MRFYFLLMITIFISRVSHADIPKSDLATASQLKPLMNEKVEFSPAPQHHFNLEAPQKCTKQPLKQKDLSTIQTTARKITCQFHKPGKYTTTVSVCDNEKKYCKQENFKVEVQNSASEEKVFLPKSETLDNQKKLKSVLLPGFKSLTPEMALSSLTDKHEGVLVLVSAEWCPPCNQNKEFLFPQKEVQKASQNFLKIYIDGDTPLLASWKKKFDLKYYPSFYFFNKKLELIEFGTDAVTSAQFLDWINYYKKNINNPMREVKERQLARQKKSIWQKTKDFLNKKQKKQDSLSLIRWALSNNEIINLSKFNLDPKKQNQFERWSLLEKKWEQKNKEVDKNTLKVIEKEIKELALKIIDKPQEDHPSYLGLFETYCPFDIQNDDLQKRCQKSLLNYKSYAKAKHKKLNENLTTIDKAIQAANFNKTLLKIGRLTFPKPTHLKQLHTNCFDSFELIKSFSPLKERSRTLRVEQMSCLNDNSTSHSVNLNILSGLIKDYPHEEMFYRKKARIFKKEKKYKKALSLSQSALKYSYGRIYYHNLIETAKLLTLTQQKTQAKSLLNKALSEVSISKDSLSEQRTVTQLRKAIKEIL